MDRARVTYRCANPDREVKHVTRDAHALDAYVEQLIVERLSRKGTVEKLLHRDDTADVAALRVEQVSLGARKDELAILFADGQIDAVQFATATRRLDEKATEIAATLAKVGWRITIGTVGQTATSAACGRFSADAEEGDPRRGL